jgi:hypothetical protein
MRVALLHQVASSAMIVNGNLPFNPELHTA